MAKKKVGKKILLKFGVMVLSALRWSARAAWGVRIVVASVNPNAKLTAVCDANPASAAEVGKQWGVPHFNDHRELIKANLCDMITIATPHPLHMQVAVDAMNAGLRPYGKARRNPSPRRKNGASRKTQQCGFHGNVPIAVLPQYS